MRVVDLPFNAFIGLSDARAEEGLLISLPDSPHYQNHVGTVHASALMAVAEAASGAWLVQAFAAVPDGLPLVRTFTAQFRKPARGAVHGRCVTTEQAAEVWTKDFASRGKAVAPVAVEVVDEAGTVVMTAVVEWVVLTRRPAT